MHAAVSLADDVDAVALIVPTSTRRHRARVREVPPRGGRSSRSPTTSGSPTSSRSSGACRAATIAYPDTVDELVDSALECARDFAGLSPGGRAVLTAGRATGTLGATNLIMLREIP